MTFKQNIARFVIGEIDFSSIPNIASQALEQGLDTPSLRILAGLSKDENTFIINNYLTETLREMSIELPDERHAAIEVALAIAEEIFEDKRTVFEGVCDIISNAINSYPFQEESKYYALDSISFESVYGLYYSLDDLRNAGSTQWSGEKTNEELEKELTEELITELRVWSAKMKNEAL